MSWDRVDSASAKHAKPGGRVFGYGTAGFRTKADLLDSVVFRVGLLAALRSKKMHGQTIGVMITASHNTAEDNGIKIVDPQGEMLEASWETWATTLANAESDKDVVQTLSTLAAQQKIDMEEKANVIFAQDTRQVKKEKGNSNYRPSGDALVAALTDGLTALDVHHQGFGLLTTPQLHYLVKCFNTGNAEHPYGTATEEDYYVKLATAFSQLMRGKKSNGPLFVDCANGVGAPKLKRLVKHLPPGVLELQILNDDVQNPAKLNFQCGADYVKTSQKAPPAAHVGADDRCASFDGDADRIIYYFTDSDGKFNLLDGDKIATLAAMFIMELVKAAGVDIRVGLVQTAYANGSATSYANKVLKIPVECVPTGVKYLHHEAQRFDCGVYFEANGHGTVLFSPNALAIIESHEAQNPAQQTATKHLQALAELINQSVGDALSDMLLVETILAHKDWAAEQWISAYNDLPNRLVRAVVKDRTVFKTTDAERKLVEPKGLQERINDLVAKFKDGRAFVRASGTEDVVRVYAEAATRKEADDLAYKVADMLAGY